MSTSGITFSNGGLVSGSNFTIVSPSTSNVIVANTSGVKSAFVNASNAMNKLSGTFVEFKKIDYCHNRRGGPRSKIFCEVPKKVPHDIHSGRGNTGYWFSWRTRE